MRLLARLITLALVSSPLLAHADTFTTFNAVNDPVLTGSIVLDVTQGYLESANLIYDGAGTSVPAINTSQGPDGSTGYLFTFQAGSDFLRMYVTATGPLTIAGYTGGEFDLTDEQLLNAGNPHSVTSGTLVPEAPPSAVPEPSSLVLLGTGALGLAGALRRRLAA